MTQPVKQQTVEARQGWNYVVWHMGRHLPYSLTHGANALRAVLKLTGGR